MLNEPLRAITRLSVKTIYLFADLRGTLLALGCHISRTNRLTYPIGSVREELAVPLLEKRYEVTLPNGVKIREIYIHAYDLYNVLLVAQEHMHASIDRRG